MLLSRLFVVALPILLAPSIAAAETLQFDCLAKDGITREQLKVDLGTNTATLGLGWPTPAVVTDDTVSWSSWADSKSVTYMFYRKRGDLARAPQPDTPDPDRDGLFTCKQRYKGQTGPSY